MISLILRDRLQNFALFVTQCYAHNWDKFWKILTFEFCQNRQVMINHRGGILIFGQILNFGENRKFEILNPSSNPNFGSLTLNQILDFGKFWILLNLILSNLDRSRRSFPTTPKLSNLDKIWSKNS